MIAVVDYGMGNLKSVEKGLKKVGCEVLITRDFAKIKESRGLVLPGVGSFRDCMRNLKERELIQPILNFVASGRPFLGICLGMQILIRIYYRTDKKVFKEKRNYDEDINPVRCLLYNGIKRRKFCLKNLLRKW